MAMSTSYRLPFSIAFGLALAAPVHAEEEGETSNPALGLDPATPQSASLPGGTAPTVIPPPGDVHDFRFDFHGMFTAPLRIGLNTRKDPAEGQSETVLHAPPVVPDDLETWSHTGVVPTPYAQLNFSYGSSVVTGTASLVARVPNVASGYFDPPSQLGINDLFLTVNPELGGNEYKFALNIGAFSNRYGSAGEYDEGRYGTPFIARVNGVGENIVGKFALGDFALLVEQGIQGQSSKAPIDIVPDVSNDHADPSVGSSFASHVHLGVGYKGAVTLGGHYLVAWTQDDRATKLEPDGSLDIIGADLRLTLGRFGHLYGAFSKVNAEYVGSVGRIVEVLNTRGGPGLIENYLGAASNGNGGLNILGFQYDLSIGRLVSYPVPFYGDGPDLYVSLFGAYANVESDDPFYDGVSKLKVGGEGTYSLLPWLAVSARYDRVAPNTDNDRYSFAVVSPRVIFRTGWQARDQVVLGYSHWFNGTLTTVRTGFPPRENITVIPDEDMVSLSANMWW